MVAISEDQRAWEVIIRRDESGIWTIDGPWSGVEGTGTDGVREFLWGCRKKKFGSAVGSNCKEVG